MFVATDIGFVNINNIANFTIQGLTQNKIRLEFYKPVNNAANGFITFTDDYALAEFVVRTMKPVNLTYWKIIYSDFPAASDSFYAFSEEKAKQHTIGKNTRYKIKQLTLKNYELKGTA